MPSKFNFTGEVIELTLYLLGEFPLRILLEEDGPLSPLFMEKLTRFRD
jgi:hypothetical protein